MPENSFQDKTEPATPRKKEEARKKGQVARSKELSSIIVLSAGVLYLFFGAKGLMLDLGGIITQTFSDIPRLAAMDDSPITLVYHIAEEFLFILLPIFLVLVTIALLGNFLQTGIVWSVESLTPKASKINPMEGLKKIFSMRSMVEFAKSLLKVIIVGWVAIVTLRGESAHLMPLMYQDNIQIISFLAQVSLTILVRCCAVIAILAILDYFYQRWEYEKNLKMTKQEVKDEQKQTEGDPYVKARIRSIQREMARRRMMEEVPKADVIITNPTHLAVALRYDLLEGMQAPTVIAKGANKIAARIKEIAKDNDIPLVENKPLAQNLYKIEIGEEIPPQLYQAVAEIIAYVYNLKNKRAHKG